MKGSYRSTAQAEPRTQALEEASDAALGAALGQGDQSALAALYDRHMPGIYDHLARYVRDPFAAEDLVQTTFVRAWERRETLRDPGGVKAWLFTIAHNLATNQLTRTRPVDPVEDHYDLATPGLGPEQEATSRESAELVWAAASSLEPRQYAVLDLCLRRELSTREVADVLGTSVGHAAVLVNRAKEALGNAVRYLLVAQRRDKCERLAALVPAGVRALTPEQRSAVDHHMRRCDDCQRLARSLTSPAELFGGLVSLPVPGSLLGDRRDYVLRSARSSRSGDSETPQAGLARLPKWVLFVGGLALLALGATVVVRTQSPATLMAPIISSPAPAPSAAGQASPTAFPASAPISNPALVPDGQLPGVPTPTAPTSPRPSASAAPSPQPTSSPEGSPPATKPTPAASPAIGRLPSTGPTPKAPGHS
jgi:RNA polymerase sigma factor (sigma-70 family)